VLFAVFVLLRLEFRPPSISNKLDDLLPLRIPRKPKRPAAETAGR
jgi:hypothetical protein